MSSGILGKAALAAGTNTNLYTVPAGKVTTANINLCNRTSASVTVRIAIRSTVQTDADYIEYDTTLPANGVLERTAIVLAAGEIITVYASADGVSARVHGFEESA
jgi:hypothetical protein